MISFALFVLAFLLLVYFGLAGATYAVLWRNSATFAAFKNQPAPATARQLRLEIGSSLMTIVTWTVLACGVYWLSERNVGQIYRELTLSGVPYFIASFFVVQFLHETYFYWTHRAYHSGGGKGLLWAAHRFHHRFGNPTPFAALAFHPVEGVVHGLFMTGFGLLVPVHVAMVFYYAFFMMLVNVAGHMGHEFWPTGLHRHPVWKHLNTPTHHNLHHTNPRYGFGIYYNFWDTLMGTNDPAYEAEYNQVKERTNAFWAARRSPQAASKASHQAATTDSANAASVPKDG